MAQYRLSPIGPAYEAFESVSVTDTATSLTAATVAQYTHALITCETAVVRFRLDGTNPTASVGHELAVGDSLALDSNDQLLNARFIRRDGVSATLRCSYGR